MTLAVAGSSTEARAEVCATMVGTAHVLRVRRRGALMGWTPPDGIAVPRWRCRPATWEASVEQASTIGLDLAKRIFQAHGADASGRVAFRKRLARAQVVPFFAAQPPCVVAMEACAGAQVRELDAEITRRAKADPVARRLMTVPGIGPIAATAAIALVPAPGGFRAGRDFAAWLGLTPLQKSSGGKQKLGAITKRGERTVRRLLILGASAVVRWAGQRGAPQGSWLARMLARDGLSSHQRPDGWQHPTTRHKSPEVFPCPEGASTDGARRRVDGLT